MIIKNYIGNNRTDRLQATADTFNLTDVTALTRFNKLVFNSGQGKEGWKENIHYEKQDSALSISHIDIERKNYRSQSIDCGKKDSYNSSGDELLSLKDNKRIITDYSSLLARQLLATERSYETENVFIDEADKNHFRFVSFLNFFKKKLIKTTAVKNESVLKKFKILAKLNIFSNFSEITNKKYLSLASFEELRSNAILRMNICLNYYPLFSFPCFSEAFARMPIAELFPKKPQSAFLVKDCDPEGLFKRKNMEEKILEGENCQKWHFPLLIQQVTSFIPASPVTQGCVMDGAGQLIHKNL